MKMYRACPDILSSEKDDFKFFKTAKNIKCTCITCTIVPGLILCFVSPNQLVVDQTHERNSSQELYYIFSEISKFRYW